MGKLIMWNMLSLDGHFEGFGEWDLSWHQNYIDTEFNAFAFKQLAAADKLIFGRITYEGMAAHWLGAPGKIANLMNTMPKIVFSNRFFTKQFA